MRVDQQRPELLALPFAPANRERAERDAVIALLPRDEIAPLRLAPLDKILPREFQRRFGRLGTARDEHHMIDAVRRVRDEIVRQLFRDAGREETGMRVFEMVELAAQGGEHVGMRMAKARHGGAAGGIEIVLAIGVTDEKPLPADGNRVIVTDRAMQDMRHDFTDDVFDGTT